MDHIEIFLSESVQNNMLQISAAEKRSSAKHLNSTLSKIATNMRVISEINDKD